MTYHFRLYVAGNSPASSRATTNLATLCRRVLPGRHEIEIIDVLERPDLAADASVLATPLVIQLDPKPVRRTVGDFTDIRHLATALGLPIPLPEQT